MAITLDQLTELETLFREREHNGQWSAELFGDEALVRMLTWDGEDSDETKEEVSAESCVGALMLPKDAKFVAAINNSFPALLEAVRTSLLQPRIDLETEFQEMLQDAFIYETHDHDIGIQHLGTAAFKASELGIPDNWIDNVYELMLESGDIEELDPVDKLQSIKNSWGRDFPTTITYAKTLATKRK